MLSLRFTKHVAISRAIVCALHPSALLDAFNASNSSAITCCTRRNTTVAASAPSGPVATRPGASNVAQTSGTLTPQYVGVTIVASVGLDYASFANTKIQHRLSLLQASQFSASLGWAADLLQSSVLDIDIDDEVPKHAAPYIPVYLSMAPFLTRPTKPTNAAGQSNKVNIGIQTTSPPTSSSFISPWCSHSGSDFSFECVTPAVGCGAEVHDVDAPRVVGASETTSPLAASLPTQGLRNTVDALEEKVTELMTQYQDAITYSAQLDTLSLDLSNIPYSDDDDVERTDGTSADTTTNVDSIDGSEDSVDDGASARAAAVSVVSGSTAEPYEAPRREPIVLHNEHSDTVYVVPGIIGEGSFSRVAAAVSNGAAFGIKVVHKANVYGHTDARERLLLEKQVMAEVASFNTDRLVRLLESWESRPNIYFVMPLYGCSLYQLLHPSESTSMPHITAEDERLMCADIISGLSVLHRHGIMHRDIKPENCFVDDRGGVALGDFGLVQRTAGVGIQDLVCREVCGTPQYYAPEQRRPGYGYKADIWALGCTLIEFLARLDEAWIDCFGDSDPLESNEPPEQVQRLLWWSVRKLLPRHPALNLLRKMINLDPDARPTTEQIKMDPWFEGIDWDAIERGPATNRSLSPELPDPDVRRSPRYSSFDQDNRKPAAIKDCKTLDECDAVYDNIVLQMELYDDYPLAFVHPPPSPTHTA